MQNIWAEIKKIQAEMERAYEKVKNEMEGITYLDCKLAIEYSSGIFHLIPEEFRTEELCLLALKINKGNDNLIKSIPKKILTKEFVVSIVEVSGADLQYIPKDLVDKEIVLKAVKNTIRAFNYIPKEYQTEELYKELLSINHKIVKKIPKKLLTRDICIYALTLNWKAFKYIPNKFKDREVCLLAYKKDYRVLEFIPEGVFSKEDYACFLDDNWKTFRYFPNNLRTKELYKNVIQKMLSLKKNPCNLRVIYENLGQLAYSLDFSVFDDDIIDIERKLSIRYVIESFYCREKNQFIVKENYFSQNIEKRIDTFEEFYFYLQGDLVNSNLIEYDFKDIDISKYNLNGVELNSEILIKKGGYNPEFYNKSILRFSNEVQFLPVLNNENGLTKIRAHEEPFFESLNSYQRRMYYITDIHLNHQLFDRFPQHATYSEIEFFIKKYVENLIDTAQEFEYGDYLLIGGDVSFSFEISEIFYRELCKVWHPSCNIIVVLGNHELWDCDIKNENTKVEELINRYRSLFNELGISFLHNSLLVKGRNQFAILEEQDILNKSAEELNLLVMKSNMVVFGGIGFSAYNGSFNATHGIYRRAITSLEKDLQYTQQTEKVYDKLYDILWREKVIVLSHMPPKDWAHKVLVPNWIYINGHTHHNYFIKSEESTVYADNQVGYKLRNPVLKYFKIDCNYDIFRNYTDGIYHITKEQYRDFNIGKGIECYFNRDFDYIIMLKRESIYLFLVENQECGKLYLLNGGMIKRLKITDIEYYYENMLKYANYIQLGIKEYNNALKSISHAVQKIGGEGYIHGSIVDIDYYNHIYLDPKSGAISAYYSPFMGQQYRYDNVEDLLCKQLPILYENYKGISEDSTEILLLSNKVGSFSNMEDIVDNIQYKSSRLMKVLQYITEKNIIRVWNDELIYDDEKYIEKQDKLLIK